MQTNNGFMGVICGVIIALCILILVIGAAWDLHRFIGVDNAKTTSELRAACKEYDMATLKQVPAKCFPYIGPLNVN